MTNVRYIVERYVYVYQSFQKEYKWQFCRSFPTLEVATGYFRQQVQDQGWTARIITEHYSQEVVAFGRPQKIEEFRGTEAVAAMEETCNTPSKSET